MVLSPCWSCGGYKIFVFKHVNYDHRLTLPHLVRINNTFQQLFFFCCSFVFHIGKKKKKRKKMNEIPQEWMMGRIFEVLYGQLVAEKCDFRMLFTVKKNRFCCCC